MEIKCTEIERENRILLEKMQSIIMSRQENFLAPTTSTAMKLVEPNV